jgi:predicted ribonuclease YlaK
LGGRNELKNFLKDADIVIPEIVIQEIKRQKKKTLESGFLSRARSVIFGSTSLFFKSITSKGITSSFSNF